MSVLFLILIGMGGLAVIGVVVGVMDAAQARAWRRVAAERRRNWEVRHGGGYLESWSDEDSD